MSDLSVWTDDERTAGRRRRKKRRKSGFAVLLSLLVVFALVAGLVALLFGAGAKLRDALTGDGAPDYPGPGAGSVLVEIKQGETAADMGRTLKAKRVVKSVDAFIEVANAEPEAASIQPGFYRMKRELPAADALALLLDPSSQVRNRVTLPEGLRLDETLKRLAKGSDLPLADFEKALEQAQDLGLPDYARANAEGFLYPATYDLPPHPTATGVLRQLFEAYAVAEEGAGVTRTPRSPYEIVIIASLIEGEARHASDFGKVARVVYNRLDKGMPLQFDSTVNYALRADKQIVTHADLGVDSPYNTYKNTGLPPGPISSPGKAALAAAVNPTEGDWLYFVTVDPQSGETKFTGDYQEFLRFKRELKSNQ